MTVDELIEKLREDVPAHWRVLATRAGSSLEAWDEEGDEYAFVFTDDRQTLHLRRRRRLSRDG